MSQPRPEPLDYDEFWSALSQRGHAIAPRTIRMPSSERHIEQVSFESVDGVRLGGWLALPAGEIRSAVILAHGYGGRSALDPRWAPEDAAVLYPIARGMPTLSLIDDIPSVGREHVLHGIQSRETYVHGGCAADIWCAVSALEELLEMSLGERNDGLRLGYFGPSFGAGIGAMAIPCDERIDAASLYVPAFGAHSIRLAVPSVGSTSSLRVWVAEHPEAWDVLDYFDAATSAARITVPTIIAPAHNDPTVPPIGQFAVANAVPEQYRHIMPMTAGHHSYPEEEAEMAAYAEATRELFAAR